jgi:hypothetical protein
MRAVSTAASGIRHVLGATAQSILIVAIIAALLVAYAAATNTRPGGAIRALAARGGASAGSTATLTVSPNPVAAWSSFEGSGCGYRTGKQVNINVSGPSWNAGFPVGVDASGCISFQFWVDGPGTYSVTAMQNLSGHKQTVLARATLTAV